MSGRNIALGSFTKDGVKFLMERLGLARFLRSSECRKSSNVQTPGEKWTLFICVKQAVKIKSRKYNS